MTCHESFISSLIWAVLVIPSSLTAKKKKGIVIRWFSVWSSMAWFCCSVQLSPPYIVVWRITVQGFSCQKVARLRHFLVSRRNQSEAKGMLHRTPVDHRGEGGAQLWERLCRQTTHVQIDMKGQLSHPAFTHYGLQIEWLQLERSVISKQLIGIFMILRSDYRNP